MLKKRKCLDFFEKLFSISLRVEFVKSVITCMCDLRFCLGILEF